MTLRYELKERAEASLYSFFIQSWPIIEGHSKFVDEWFLEVIAEHLELVYYRKIKNLPYFDFYNLIEQKYCTVDLLGEI